MKCPNCQAEIEFDLKLKGTADWRKDKPTRAQLNLLDNMRVPYTKDITKGEASALIEAHKYVKDRDGY
jgi:hypothetical protein